MPVSITSTRDQLFQLSQAMGRCQVRLAPLASTDHNPGNRRLRKRHAQYAAGRTHAAQLLTTLGASDTSVTSAADGSPVWPAGFVGSISHTDQLIGVAVAHCDQVRSVGIDLESIIEDGIADEVGSLCLSPSERNLGNRANINHALFTTVCFSAKEALYKCLYPLVGCFFDFSDARIVELNERARTIHIRLLSDLNDEFIQGLQLQASYRCEGDHVFTVFELPVLAGRVGDDKLSIASDERSHPGARAFNQCALT